MGAKEFGQFVDQHMRERGWLQGRLAYELGQPSGHIWNETQIRRLRLGQRHLDHALVERVIEVFELDADEAAEAWHTAGLLPPGLSVDDLRRLHADVLTGSAPGPPLPGSAASSTLTPGCPTPNQPPLVTLAA